MAIIDKNTLYEGLQVPPLVEAAVSLARQNDFPFSCTPAQGRLLQVLALAARADASPKPAQGTVPAWPGC